MILFTLGIELKHMRTICVPIKIEQRFIEIVKKTARDCIQRLGEFFNELFSARTFRPLRQAIQKMRQCIVDLHKTQAPLARLQLL